MANVSRTERVRRQWAVASNPKADVTERQIAIYALAQQGQIDKAEAAEYSRRIQSEPAARPAFVPEALRMGLSDMDQMAAEIAKKEGEIMAQQADPMAAIMAKLAEMQARIDSMAGAAAPAQPAQATPAKAAPAKAAPAKAEPAKAEPATAKTITLLPIPGNARDGRIRYELRLGAGQLYAIVYWPLSEQAPSAIEATLRPQR